MPAKSWADAWQEQMLDFHTVECKILLPMISPSANQCLL